MQNSVLSWTSFTWEIDTLELTLVPMTTAGLRIFGFSVVCVGFLMGILMGVRKTVGLQMKFLSIPKKATIHWLYLRIFSEGEKVRVGVCTEGFFLLELTFRCVFRVDFSSCRTWSQSQLPWSHLVSTIWPVSPNWWGLFSFPANWPMHRCHL